MLELIFKMGRLARSEVEQAKQAFLLRDVAVAEDLVRQDERDQPAQPLRVRPGGGDRHRRRPARVGDVDDARGARASSGSATTPWTSASRWRSSSPGCSGSSRTPRTSPARAETSRVVGGSRSRDVNSQLPGFEPGLVTGGSGVYAASEMMWSANPRPGSGAPAPPRARPAIRLAVIDSDTGFLQVLGKRLEGVGWQLPRARHAGAAGRDGGDAAQRRGRRPRGARARRAGRTWRSCAPGCPAWAWSSAPASPPSPSGCAGCGWAPTTGSPSPATRRS